MQFGDLRGWIAALKREGELHEVEAEVDWNCELGTVTRRAFGNGDGPALLFNNIKDYQHNARCSQLFTGGLSRYSRVAMMFGLPKNAPITELVKAARKAFSGRVPPVKVATGPVKQNIITGDDINLYDFPVPQWHRRDGGRYINTMQGTVTRDPISGRMNVGIYRGMIGHKNTIPVLLWRPQNWGQDFAKYTGKGEEMPVAFIYGWEPCLPFCGNGTPFRGEKHPVHGETANARWRFESLENSLGRTCLHLSLRTKIRSGRVDKKISLIEGQNTLYSRHLISGMRGPMNLGHHAMLKFPGEPGSGRLSTSPFVHGQVFPMAFESAEQGGYSSLKQGAEFDSLEAVPMSNGEKADLSRCPARRGYEDLIMVVSDDKAEFAWTAVAFPKERFVWFALKDPRVLRETVFWISNGGRHYPPWSSRHVNVMGLEEVTSFFHLGLAESAARNALSARGIPTCLRLDPRKPLAVNYIMGVASIPAGFDRVVSIEPQASRQAITLQSASGKSTEAQVDLDFLFKLDD